MITLFSPPHTLSLSPPFTQIPPPLILLFTIIIVCNPLKKTLKAHPFFQLYQVYSSPPLPLYTFSCGISPFLTKTDKERLRRSKTPFPSFTFFLNWAPLGVF